MSGASRGRAAYRTLLRAVDKHITAVGGNTTWRDAVRDRFRASAAEADAAAAEAGVRRAEDLAFLVNSVNDHKARVAKAPAAAGFVPQRAACRGAALPPYFDDVLR